MQGDLQENVISNVMHGVSPLQLAGMAEVSAAHGVAVWRPLLPHDKDAIFAFAHRFGVPYFRDTTPSWSTRGKLRNQLLPLLKDMYGAGFLNNLSALAAASDENRQLLEHNLYEPFQRSARRPPCGAVVCITPYAAQPRCFWAEALRQLMHSMSMPMVRDKSVGNFVEYIQRPGLQTSSGYTWLELRKGFYTLLTAAGDLYIFRDGVFSDRSRRVDIETVAVPIDDGEVTLQLGAWTVRIAVTKEEEPEYSLPSQLEDAVMQGNFSYCIRPARGVTQLCPLGSPLAATFLASGKGKKKSIDSKRLFKCADAKLVNGLPLLVEAKPRGDGQQGRDALLIGDRALVLMYSFRVNKAGTNSARL